MIGWILGATSSFCLGFALALVVRSVATRLGHVDRPGAGKRHNRPVPLGGGIAIFWAIALPAAAMAKFGATLATSSPILSPVADLHAELAADASRLLGFLAGGLLIHLAGVWDDQRALSPAAKLAIQIITASALVVFFDVGVLPRWLDPVSSAVLATLWIVAVTNAFNFLDGADGLASVVGALCAAMFALSALLSGQSSVGFLCSLLIGALLAFLCFNFPPAKIFMGDGGSQVVGFALAVLSLRMTYSDGSSALQSPWYAVFTPLVVLAIPLYDLVTVVALRLVQRRSPFRGDDQHFLHRLARRGLGPRGVLVVVGACTVATGLGGVMLARLEAWQALLVVLQTAMILTVLALLELHLGRSDLEIVGGDAAASPPPAQEPRAAREREAAS